MDNLTMSGSNYGDSVTTHQITEIKALEIIDNRGNPTIRTSVTVDGIFVGVADVPSGSSTGSFEAKELRDGGRRYNGMGVKKAIDNIQEKIAPALIGRDSTNQRAIDRMMIDIDGTQDKSRLGANAILGVSLATAKAAAQKGPVVRQGHGNRARRRICCPQACPFRD